MAQVQKPFESDIPNCICGEMPTVCVQRNPHGPIGCFVSEIECQKCGMRVGPAVGNMSENPSFIIEKWKEELNKVAIERTNMQAMKENGMLDDEEEPLVELKERPKPEPNTYPYVVEIEETYRRKVIVWAENNLAAINKADKLYEDGHIDLSRNCYNGHETISLGAASEQQLKLFDDFG